MAIRWYQDVYKRQALGLGQQEQRGRTLEAPVELEVDLGVLRLGERGSHGEGNGEDAAGDATGNSIELHVYGLPGCTTNRRTTSLRDSVRTTSAQRAPQTAPIRPC